MLLCYMHCFSRSITAEINKLVIHAQNYRTAKSLEDKSNVINDIKDDPIFERTQRLIQMESESVNNKTS